MLVFNFNKFLQKASKKPGTPSQMDGDTYGHRWVQHSITLCSDTKKELIPTPSEENYHSRYIPLTWKKCPLPLTSFWQRQISFSFNVVSCSEYRRRNTGLVVGYGWLRQVGSTKSGPLAGLGSACTALDAWHAGGSRRRRSRTSISQRTQKKKNSRRPDACMASAAVPVGSTLPRLVNVALAAAQHRTRGSGLGRARAEGVDVRHVRTLYLCVHSAKKRKEYSC